MVTPSSLKGAMTVIYEGQGCGTMCLPKFSINQLLYLRFFLKCLKAKEIIHLGIPKCSAHEPQLPGSQKVDPVWWGLSHFSYPAHLVSVELTLGGAQPALHGE